ncbi:1,4-beta-xylanase [Streptomyces sp. 3MP-14]|uniref:1,4-beta-xylanase n=1 Tax=Streptomyces mimosae TaxID=2586635 RepID=A0A5N6AF03_9ACTN|nr:MULTISPECIES: glycoside hydrolase family 43 protein [Streptomyces]KAB8166390.1 1,4-beta-xylanase [Streptomyces mimosae]KAB8174183.1 1,4-beta-xylanase [Streptomyces sp. 3MP-14]
MRTGLLRLSVPLFALALLLTSVQMAGGQRAASAQEPYTGYLMAHFTGEHPDGEQLHLSHSDDGLHWTDLNGGQPVLRSTVGTRGVRDPALVRSPEGDRYWIVATDLHIGSGTSWDDAMNRGSTSLVVWESKDLVTWSEPRLLDVAGAIADAGNAWAPEAIFDPDTGDFLVYWATNSTVDEVRKHRIWYARTRDFVTASEPRVYIDRPGDQGIIDTQIIEVPDGTGGWRYYRASGDGQLTVEAADSLLGTWTRLGDLSHLGLTGSDVEGPMWAKFNDRNEWALWLDQYATGRGYLPLVSPDLGDTHNFQRTDGHDLGDTRKRHGSILNLTSAEEQRLLRR